MRHITVFSMAALLAGIVCAQSGEAADARFTCWSPGAKTLMATANYWTPARMAAAKPDGHDMPDPVQKDKTKLLGDAERAPVTTAPYSYGGKLFFTRGGSDFAASAQFVEDQSIIMGAAHSLWRPGAQATNITFVLGYDNGGGTSFSVDQAAVLTQWTTVAGDPPTASNAQYDYSIMRVTSQTSEGAFYTLGGALLGNNVTVTGYPGRLEGGKYMYNEPGKIEVIVGKSYESQPHPMYGGGASGGAWFTGSAAPYTIVSVVSNGNAYSVLGAEFTKDTADMVTYVKGGCQ